MSKYLTEKHLPPQYHETAQRPWGNYMVLEQQKGFKVKRIEVLAGKRLSLQSHEKRSEHWTIAKGTAKIQCGDSSTVITQGGFIIIPKKAIHRLENIGRETLIVIEVQMGDYLEEDDITRYEDDFQRD